MRKVTFDNKFFISRGFIKSKNRFIEGTPFTACRPLGDFRALNDSVVPPPYHWAFLCNDQQSLCACVPLGMTHFKYYDIDNAYHTCLLCCKPLQPVWGPNDRADHTDAVIPCYTTLDLVVVDYNGTLYQYLGDAQGISCMALF